MNREEENSIVLKFLIMKRDNLIKEINFLTERLTLLNSSIDFMNTSLIYNEQKDTHSHEIMLKTLTSMYLDRERFQMNILEKEALVIYFLDIILGLGASGE